MFRGWKILLWLAFALVVALATLPWWLGVALKPILHAQRITFERYERVGYDRFKLIHAEYAHPSVTVQADEVISDTPLLWWLKRVRHADSAISVSRWRLQVIHNPNPSPGPRTVNGMADLQPLLIRLMPILHRWLAKVELGPGELRGFTPELSLAHGIWNDSGLRVDELRGLAGLKLNVMIATTPENNFSVDAGAAAKDDAQVRFVWSPAEITAVGTWWNQPLKADAHYAAQGWLPADATITAENWQLPAERLKLGVPYERVLGSSKLTWRDGTFEVSLNGKALPEGKAKAPPFEVDAVARGNFHEISLNTLHVNVPFATASLSAPVTFSVAHPLAANPADLTIKMDLAKFPWLKAAGKAEGHVKVSPDTAGARQLFEFSFSDISLDGLALQKGSMQGALEWPLLTLEKFEVQLDKTSYVKAQGAVDWQARVIKKATLEGKAGSYWLGRWLPNNINWTAIEISAQVDGSLDAPEHHGSFQLTQIKLPALRPINASVTWTGIGRKMDFQSAHATANDSSIEASGTLEPQHLVLNKVVFAPQGQPVWQLPAPAHITWGEAWQIADLQLNGARSQLTFKGKGGPDGFIEINTTGFDSTWLQDWIAVSGPHWQMHSLQARGHAEHGVLAFDTQLTAQIDMQPRPAELRLTATGDAGGVRLKELTVVEGSRELTRASGRLPFSLRNYPNAEFQLSETEPFELTATTDPDSPLWAALTGYTGLTLEQPQAKIDLKGTLRAPTGEVHAQVARLGLRAGRFKFSLPEFQDLTLAMTLERTKVTIAKLATKVDGQVLNASGQIPMDDTRWQQLFQEPAKFDWISATARVDMPDADLAALSAHIPNLIAPKGRLRASVQLKEGGKLSGELHLNDATARPLPPFSTPQEINADLTLDDRTLSIQKLTAKLGGQPIVMDGKVTLVPGSLPRLSLGIKGQNLPLVRNTGLLIRNDIDLRAETDANEVTRLSGVVTLHDCLALANVGALLPSGQRGVTRQPPYFSVDAELFRNWPLAIEVRGQQAIKIRTTVFNGTASARFQLGGTLGEPRAVGELTVDSGQVLFPFATFTVQNGAVRLREADPFHAVLNLTATAQRRDYQLRLEATGELPSPNVVMSSTPALEAEDVVLMVMTGQPPNNTDVTASSAGQRLALLGAYLGRGIFQDLGIGGEDRLEISAGEQVSLQGKETYEFEYKLDKRWSLTGEYDRFDSYNAGVKWRVYTEESKPAEKK